MQWIHAEYISVLWIVSEAVGGACELCVSVGDGWNWRSGVS